MILTEPRQDLKKPVELSETKCAVDSFPVDVPFGFIFAFKGMSYRQFDFVWSIHQSQQ